MTRSDPDRWLEAGRNRAYRRAVRDRLDAGGRVRETFEAWRSFRRAARGAPFADDATAEAAFLDALAVDRVVAGLVRLVERHAGVRLANPGVRANVPTLPAALDLDAVHARVDGGDPGTTADRLADAVPPGTLRSLGPDDLRTLYARSVSRGGRDALGEFYTPRGVADLAVGTLDRLEADPVGSTVLDPGCGAGVFLAVRVDRHLAAAGLAGDDGHGAPGGSAGPDDVDPGGSAGPDDVDPDAVVERVTRSVVGIDLNPVAVRSAKLAVLLALVPALERAAVDAVELPVFCTDALGVIREDDLRFRGEPFEPRASALVGNPPWLTWDRLPEGAKRRWREASAAHDLFPQRGASARLGHGNDDVSVPFVWLCVRRYLEPGGVASVVLKRDLLKGPAGRLLRTGSVDGRPLAVAHVHDLGGLRPFDGVDVDAAIYGLVADTSPGFPVEATDWRPGEGEPRFDSLDALRGLLRRERTAFVPLDRDGPTGEGDGEDGGGNGESGGGDDGDGASDPATGPWVRVDAERAALGGCEHEIRHGVKDDAAAVYGPGRDRLLDLEPDHVYPYLKSRHVVKYGLFGHDLRLVPQRKAGADNEAALARDCPRTYDYLDTRRERLDARASSWLDGGPFYSVFGLGPYTWRDYKVVWCRLGFKPHFAVVSTVADPDLGERQVVPGDHCMFLATDDRREAHLLCALLNAAPYQRTLRDVAAGGKSSLSKSVVSRLALPAWEGTPRERRLADLSIRAHRVVADRTDEFEHKRAYNRATFPELAAVQAEIDEAVETMLTGGRVDTDGTDDRDEGRHEGGPE